MILTVRDRMTTTFITLNSDEKLADAYAALQSQTGPMGVVVHQGQPVTVIAPTDVEEHLNLPDQRLSDMLSKLPPGMIVGPDMTLEAFVNSSEITVLDEGAHGAIIVEQDQVVGVLSKDAIAGYLVQEYESLIRTKGAAGLDGSIVTPRIIKFCDEFGHRNEIRRNPGYKALDCQVKQPYIHPLKRRT